MEARVDNLTVLQAKRYGIFSCSSDSTLVYAAQLMVQEDISGLVVVDQDGFLAGIFTRTDLLRAVQNNPSWRNLKVSDFMNTGVVTVSPHDHLDHVASLLLAHQIHRVVIVEVEDGKKRPIGVISDADITFHLTRTY
jgi:CBS domain-containing protein